MLVGSVEHGTVDQAPLIVYKHLVVQLGHFTVAHIEYLILKAAG